MRGAGYEVRDTGCGVRDSQEYPTCSRTIVSCRVDMGE